MVTASLGPASWAFILALLGVGVFLAVFGRRRYLALQHYRFPPITPSELRKRLLSGHDLLLLDLRHELDWLAHPYVIPGAVRIAPKHLESARLHQLRPDRLVVFYCTCPSEPTQIRTAASLAAKGFMRVRPLAGGLQAWVDSGFDIEFTDAPPSQPTSSSSLLSQRQAARASVIHL